MSGTFGHRDTDFLFFHTGLDKHEYVNDIIIVCESALVIEHGRSAHKDKDRMLYVSGGWALIHFA